MNDFYSTWQDAARTSVGLFWTAFWAFGLGYLISSMIQVFVTESRMREAMGTSGPKSVGLGTFFGFISSSCSFAALSTTRALFTKGASLVSSLAFLLASTNLVIELGIVIGVFLGWQFVVGEYVGGLFLIGLMWPLVKLTLPKKLAEDAREHAEASENDGEEDDATDDWKALLLSADGWKRVAKRYAMEWVMVWKDVIVGFTVAGVIAAFVPPTFFETLFVGAGQGETSALEVLAQVCVGPLVAFFTFIGSMGNIPLAAVLFGNGVSFGGVIAFIFSDLVVLPVVRIQAKYYGWKMALYITGVLLAVLVATAMVLHYGFAFAGQLPDPASVRSVTERDFFTVDYAMVLNIIFGALSVGAFGWAVLGSKDSLHPIGRGLVEHALFVLALTSLVWLLGGFLVPLVTG